LEYPQRERGREQCPQRDREGTQGDVYRQELVKENYHAYRQGEKHGIFPILKERGQRLSGINCLPTLSNRQDKEIYVCKPGMVPQPGAPQEQDRKVEQEAKWLGRG